MTIEIEKTKAGQEDDMQKLVKAFENIMVAVTFAESGEYDEVRRVSGQAQVMDEAENIGASVKAASQA